MRLTWTDDRLRSETDSGFTNTFLYEAGGNRTHKRRSTLETCYVNPNYVVKDSLTESKHIMLGNDRVVTAVSTQDRPKPWRWYFVVCRRGRRWAVGPANSTS